jgi:hypothetical protein
VGVTEARTGKSACKGRQVQRSPWRGAGRPSGGQRCRITQAEQEARRVDEVEGHAQGRASREERRAELWTEEREPGTRRGGHGRAEEVPAGRGEQREAAARRHRRRAPSKQRGRGAPQGAPQEIDGRAGSHGRESRAGAGRSSGHGGYKGLGQARGGRPRRVGKLDAEQEHDMEELGRAPWGELEEAARRGSRRRTQARVHRGRCARLASAGSMARARPSWQQGGAEEHGVAGKEEAKRPGE